MIGGATSYNCSGDEQGIKDSEKSVTAPTNLGIYGTIIVQTQLCPKSILMALPNWF